MRLFGSQISFMTHIQIILILILILIVVVVVNIIVISAPYIVF